MKPDKEPDVLNQRSNNNIVVREYVGDFHDAFMRSDVKHSLRVEIKVDGTLALLIYYKEAGGGQNFQAVMLTNEQRLNLGEFLSAFKPELWKDINQRDDNI